MKLRRRLIGAQRARARAVAARRHATHCAATLRRRIDTYPLADVAVAGSGGLMAGCLTARHGKSVFTLWNDPALRWLLDQLRPGA